MVLTPEQISIDVVMCVGPQDVERLFLESLLSCFKHFSYLTHLYIITPKKEQIQQKIRSLQGQDKITIYSDHEILDPILFLEDGWYKQQIIKLEAFKICKSRFIACLSSDTILLKDIEFQDLFSPLGAPILYYKNHLQPSVHYDYEKLRLQAIEKILQKPLKRANQLTDFILDFTIWDTQILTRLKDYLVHLYGVEVFKILSPGKCDTLAKKREFGEWSLYASFILDVLQNSVQVKPFENDYFYQVHSERDMDQFTGNSKIVHFVSKDIPLSKIQSKLIGV